MTGFFALVALKSPPPLFSIFSVPETLTVLDAKPARHVASLKQQPPPAKFTTSLLTPGAPARAKKAYGVLCMHVVAPAGWNVRHSRACVSGGGSAAVAAAAGALWFAA